MNCKPNNLDLRLISPKNSEKFSPNLLAYLKANKSTARYAHVFEHDEDKSMWLGFMLDGDFIGEQIMQVLCNGRRSQPGCYSTAAFVGALTCLPDFWPNYLRIGRCAVDPDHQEHFMNAEHRFTVAADGQSRGCNWCGRQQTKETWEEKIQRERWVNQPEF